MRKRLLSLSLVLPLITCFAGCDNSETPTAPNGGKKVEMKDIPAEKPAANSKVGPGPGTNPN